MIKRKKRRCDLQKCVQEHNFVCKVFKMAPANLQWTKCADCKLRYCYNHMVQLFTSTFEGWKISDYRLKNNDSFDGQYLRLDPPVCQSCFEQRKR